MFYAFLGLYSILFWALGVFRPSIALALICGSIFFQQDLSGGGAVKFSIAELNILLSVPLAFICQRKLRGFPGMAPVCIYLAICIISSLSTWRTTTTVSVVQMFIYIAVVPIVFASLITSSDQCRKALDAVLIVATPLALLPVVLGSNYVVGLHKNGLGGTLCAALLIAVELLLHEPSRRKTWIYAMSAGCISLGLLGTLSRGAWIGTISGLAVLAIWRRQSKRLIQAFLCILPILAFFWWKLPAESRQYATNLSKETWNVQARLNTIDLLLEQFRSSRVWGVGVGLRKEYDSTDIALSTLAETGIVGVLSFAAIYVTVFVRLWRARRWLPQEDLTASIAALAVALNVAKLTHGMVDHFWTRGSITLAWGFVGMTAALIPATRRRLALLQVFGKSADVGSSPALQVED